MADSSQSNAAFVLENLGLIAHQTDTVFGLACLPVERLLVRLSHLKQRNNNKKGFILLASSLEQVINFIQTDRESLNKINALKPNPTTWLVTASDSVPQSLLGPTNKIAIRITSHPGIKQICEKVGAIASTSANLSSQNICSNIKQLRAIFGPGIDYIDQNHIPGTGKSSTIVDLVSGSVLRN